MTKAVELAQVASTGVSEAFKNRIINGAMVIDQRNAGASVTANDGVFPVDRFRFFVSQSSKGTSQQSTTAPAGYINSLLFTSSSAYSVAASDYFNIAQLIEGLNVSDLAWGTANAATVTLSFWVRSSLTGTFGGAVNNSANSRSYPFSYTISAANTFEYKTVTIPGDTSGTWLTTNGIGIRVFFSLGAGSTYLGSSSAWGATDYRGGLTGATSVVGTNGATFYITGVQLEVGSTATSFDYRPYGTELALCQRYYELVSQFVGKATSAGQAEGSLTFLVQKRASPSLTVLNGTNTLLEIGVATRSFTTASGATQVNGGYVTLTGGASMTSPNMCVLYNSASIIGASAEL